MGNRFKKKKIRFLAPGAKAAIKDLGGKRFHKMLHNNLKRFVFSSYESKIGIKTLKSWCLVFRLSIQFLRLLIKGPNHFSM